MFLFHVISIIVTAMREGRFMKKVRYLAGALGFTPGLALMPGAAAAAVGPDVPCGSAATVATVSTPGKEFMATTVYHNTVSACIRSEQGSLTHQQPSLEMRTRVYSIAGFEVFHSFMHGHYGVGTTLFSQPVHRMGWEVCAALVNTKATASVRYGPVCKKGL